MLKIENECVGCTEMGLPCKGAGCPNRNVRRLYCDRCGDEIAVAYIVDGDELCEECALEALPKREVDE